MVVTFYFNFNSPYAFLAHQRIERELHGLGVELDYRPFSRGLSFLDGFSGPDYESSKVRYVGEDVRRFVKAYGLVLRPGPYADHEAALRGQLYATEQSLGRAYSERVFAARWFEARDISQMDTLRAAADAAGLDAKAFGKAVEGPRYQRELETCVRAALDEGVFGVPFFRYEGRSYWGNDRVEWLVEAMRPGAARVAQEQG